MTGQDLVQKKPKKRNTVKKVLAGDDEDDFELNLGDRDEPRAVGAEKKRKRKQESKERDLSGHGSLGKLSNEEVPEKQPTKKTRKTSSSEQQAEPPKLAEAKSETAIPQAEDPGEAKRQAERAAAKALKRKQAKLQRKARKLSTTGFELSRLAAMKIATAPLETQAEWLWNSFSTVTKATQLERAGLEESAMAAFGGGESLEERLCGFKKGWKQELATSSGVKEEGSPQVVFICASAVTANNLAKQFPTLGRGCRIGKLFAKHFKVEEQQKDLRRPMNIATGTPNRMDKLAELGSLKFDRLELAAVDVALDAKQMTILDIPDLKNDFWLLFKRHLQPRLASGAAKMVLLDSSTL